MKTTLGSTLLALLISAGLLGAATAAEARDDRRGDRHVRHHTHHPMHSDRQYDKRPPRHAARARDDRHGYRERVVIHHVPPRAPRHTVIHHHYYQPAYRSYGYSNSPALVIGVDIPPLVIPLR